MQTVLNQTAKRGSDRSGFYGICSVLSVIISWGIFSQFLLSSDASISIFSAKLSALLFQPYFLATLLSQRLSS